MLRHGRPKVLFVNRKLVFRGNVASQLEGESVGSVQLKHIGTRNRRLAGRLQVVQQPGQHIKAKLVRLVEALFFLSDDVQYELLARLELGVVLSHLVDDPCSDLRQKWLGEAGHTPVAGSATQDETQHVASALIARHHAVTHHEGHRPTVVGNHTI